MVVEKSSMLGWAWNFLALVGFVQISYTYTPILNDLLNNLKNVYRIIRWILDNTSVTDNCKKLCTLVRGAVPLLSKWLFDFTVKNYRTVSSKQENKLPTNNIYKDKLKNKISKKLWIKVCARETQYSTANYLTRLPTLRRTILIVHFHD